MSEPTRPDPTAPPGPTEPGPTAPDPTAPTAATAATAATGRGVRLGYHGSAEVASRVIRTAGWDESAVRLSQYDIADPFAELRRGTLDVMIVKFGLREPDLVTSRVLTYDARAAVVGADHPVAAHGSVSVEDLADYDAFDCPGKLPGYVWDEVVPRHTPAGRPIHRRHQVTDVPTMMRLVAGAGAVHISLVSLADIAPPAVRIVPIDDLPAAPVTLAWCRGRELPAPVHDFITAAEAGASR
ncbi:LysR substrate-binding domain-containing protein [Streptomyces sp. NBC_01142]|uniref:LysR substrate-binding domain-containing protein n=1 Tax=Streptomyces sp. NBC_01142 TaxID=2975865 RepID=UPI002258FD27|nr:LysR substrate-binding domain-containing protein [Streptomyces sp. NBC_01142]MCX4824950.1 LysR substrate-binding domain-containing protein [Streptomyces sp. NBC_01142]